MSSVPSFANSDQVKNWLERQQPEFAQLFATRAALRIIPCLPGRIKDGSPTRAEVGSLLLWSFRAASAAWAVASFPAQDEKLREVAAAAVVALETLVTFKTAGSEAAAEAARASSTNVSPARARFVCATALSAAQRVGGGIGSSIYRAASLDADLLQNGMSATDLARSALWSDNMGSISARSDWRKLASELAGLDQNWAVWISWYDARLAGSESDESLELKRGDIPEELWGRGPKSVNAYLKLLIDRHSPSEFPDPPEGPGPHLIPTPAGFELVSMPPSAAERRNPTQRSLHSQLLRRIERLKAVLPRLQNTHKALYNEFVDYDHFVHENLEDIDVPSLWSMGAALNDMVEALSRIELSSSTRSSMADGIEPDILSELRSLIRDHTTFIMGFSEGQELTARAAALRVLDIDRDELRVRTHRILGPMLTTKSLLARRAAVLIQGVNRALDAADDVTYALLSASVATATRSLVAFGRAIAPIATGAAIFSGVTGANISNLAGDPNAEALRAALSYLIHNGNSLIAFAAHDAQLKAWLAWLLSEIQKEVSSRE